MGYFGQSNVVNIISFPALFSSLSLIKNLCYIDCVHMKSGYKLPFFGLKNANFFA